MSISEVWSTSAEPSTLQALAPRMRASHDDGHMDTPGASCRFATSLDPTNVPGSFTTMYTTGKWSSRRRREEEVYLDRPGSVGNHGHSMSLFSAIGSPLFPLTSAFGQGEHCIASVPLSIFVPLSLGWLARGGSQVHHLFPDCFVRLIGGYWGYAIGDRVGPVMNEHVINEEDSRHRVLIETSSQRHTEKPELILYNTTARSPVLLRHELYVSEHTSGELLSIVGGAYTNVPMSTSAMMKRHNRMPLRITQMRLLS